METGAITGYIDVAQIALNVFWAFFAGLIYYLHKENKREGYPLESDRSQHIRVQGWPSIPGAKTFALRVSGTKGVMSVPHTADNQVADNADVANELCLHVGVCTVAAAGGFATIRLNLNPV